MATPNREKTPPKNDIKFSISLSEEQKLAKESVLTTPFNFLLGKAGSGKKHKSDGGMANQYLDSHEKNNFNMNDKHTTTADDLKLESEIKRINKLIKVL